MSRPSSYEPSYLALHGDGTLRRRAEQAVEALADCTLCPRRCGVDRLRGGAGFCRTGRRARVASAQPHFGEESPLVGRRGSGTIFLSSCNLLCTFCQNDDISHDNQGRDVGPERLGQMMLALQDMGCHNINFVTPSHVVPQILEALPWAVERGLRVPLVYNSGGYDSVSTLRLLEGIVDIYMPDFKFWDGRWADVFCRAPDYREVASAALGEMHRQVGNLELDEQRIARRGLLVRHLVMPNGVAGTREVMRFLADQISPDTYVDVIAQYRPCRTAVSDPTIGRRPSRAEHAQAVAWAREAGLRRLDRQM